METVCYYIDDLRLVKNIVNEFDMFSNILASGLRLEPDKLFAIVAIRNLHPGAYADLVKRRGRFMASLRGLRPGKHSRTAPTPDGLTNCDVSGMTGPPNWPTMSLS